MKLLAAGATNVGMKRTHNEDSLIQVPEENLFVVADGMGGHACGEVASQIAVGTVAEFFKSTSDDQEITWPYKERRGLQFEENRLATGIKLANRQIFETAQTDARKRGMGFGRAALCKQRLAPIKLGFSPLLSLLPRILLHGQRSSVEDE